MAQEDPSWKIFFEENPKPAHFDENVKLVQDFCQQAAIKKNRVALITVRFHLNFEVKLYEYNSLGTYLL